jgi:hypothetical protein
MRHVWTIEVSVFVICCLISEPRHFSFLRSNFWWISSVSLVLLMLDQCRLERSSYYVKWPCMTVRWRPLVGYLTLHLRGRAVCWQKYVISGSLNFVLWILVFMWELSLSAIFIANGYRGMVMSQSCLCHLNALCSRSRENVTVIRFSESLNIIILHN